MVICLGFDWCTIYASSLDYSSSISTARKQHTSMFFICFVIRSFIRSFVDPFRIELFSRTNDLKFDFFVVGVKGFTGKTEYTARILYGMPGKNAVQHPPVQESAEPVVAPPAQEQSGAGSSCYARIFCCVFVFVNVLFLVFFVPWW